MYLVLEVVIFRSFTGKGSIHDEARFGKTFGSFEILYLVWVEEYSRRGTILEEGIQKRESSEEGEAKKAVRTKRRTKRRE